jgi:hypothetical protein
MKVHVWSLPFSKPADVGDASGVDAHALEGRPVGDRRNGELAGLLKADEAWIKQVIDARCQQQVVFAVEAFFVG